MRIKFGIMMVENRNQLQASQVLEHSDYARMMVKTQLRDRGIDNQAVLEAMLSVPRHLFVPDVVPSTAYSDRALPTAAGQTVSQPYMVARMTQLLEVGPQMRVLEIGTGSGYQAAVLGRLGAKVISVERLEELASGARQLLGRIMPEAAIRIVVADGSLGYPAAGPYDAILVTAGAPHIPTAYLGQLVEGGRIVIPLGSRDRQVLTIARRAGESLRQCTDIACRFVPLIGADAWAEGEG